MTETEAPARRRRHARLIATAVELVGECAAAAAAVYDPIAAAPPEQVDVAVDLLPVHLLAASAPHRLDAARGEDAKRWAVVVGQEAAEDETTYLRRLAVCEAEAVLNGGEALPDASGAVPMPSPAQMAALDLTTHAADFLAYLDDDPADALALVTDLTATGEYTSRQLLADALDTAVLGACLTLARAAEQRDPSTAAETALAAGCAFAHVVTVASLDLDGPQD